MPAKAALRHTAIPIRFFSIVVDTEDMFNPELTLEKFKRVHGVEPEPPRYRVISIDVVTCPQDGLPVIVTECGLCPGFIRRMEGKIYCRKAKASES